MSIEAAKQLADERSLVPATVDDLASDGSHCCSQAGAGRGVLFVVALDGSPV
ncbi:hypothetical protein [Actinopolymorpha sp. B17G11]|uniref:hypothetical protein n=1 Tax=Actinopolymorpha sp. B17G11 TaxID=3160861 RepID=UPI0032E3C60B